MEFFNLYRSFFTISMMTGGVNGISARSITVSALLALIVFAALFILQGFALTAMAKKRGIGKRYLAFLPFVNLLYLGKLAGDCDIFGHKMKKPGLYVMIAQIVATALYALLCIAEALLFTKYAGNLTINTTTNMIVWTGLTGFAEVVNNFYNYWGDMLCSMVGLVYEILLFVIMISLLKKYYAKGYMMLSIVQLFIPLARYVILFVVRNNKAIDYDAYMKARYEEYMRRTYNGNPYNGNYGGNPYGNPYNRPPYGQNGAPYGQNQNQTPPQDPFSEFSSENQDPFAGFDDYGKKSENQPSSNGGSGGSDDGFFD